MAEYEELVELGFEGVDKFAEKYHDAVYHHLPALPGHKKSKGQEQQAQRSKDKQDNQRYQQDKQESRGNSRNRCSKHPDKGYSRERSLPSADEDAYSYQSDRKMSPYAPREGRKQRARNDDRYYEDERFYYKGPDAGVNVPRARDLQNAYALTPYQQQPQNGYVQAQHGNDPRSASGDRARPAPERRRSSWSPPQSEKHGRHERDRHRPRPRSRSRDKKHRMLATVGGALVGGFAGNQARKGKSHDTVATIVGAIVGGVGAREASEFWDDRRRKNDEKEENWEEEYGKPERNEDRRRDSSHDRDDRRR